MNDDYKTIFCVVDMFSEKQQIIQPGGQSYFIKLGKVPSYLIEFAYANNLETIHLIGPKEFLMSLERDINTYEIKNYSENKIKIEVN